VSLVEQERTAPAVESDGGQRTAGAVVIGGDYQGLGIVRSLGRRGVPVHVVDDERSIARFSRYATRSVHGADLSTPAAVAQTLLAEAERHDLRGWVLFPTRDETVAALAEHRHALSQVYRVPTGALAATQEALDKRRTYELAARSGIATPRTWYLRSLADLDEVEGAPPYAVKPAVKQPFVATTKVKAWRADSRDQLRDLVRRAAEIVPVAEVMVQELIPGDGTCQFSYCALFKDGRPLASMVARRLRQHPLEFGRSTTYARTEEEPEVERVGEQVLRALDYYGLAEVEFKRDPRDGQLKLLDVNARTWGYHSLGQAAGVDFPALLMADQLGRPVARTRARTGVSWVRAVTDLPTGLLEVRQGRSSARAYLSSLRFTSTESVFARDDVAPGLVELLLVPYLAVRRGF
jgi:predicted ATP-grasp superfamily ATP-dependent carboligase